jgi:hypothetical protein
MATSSDCSTTFSAVPVNTCGIQRAAIVMLLLASASGCGGSVKSQLPSYDPVYAGSKATELYDSNQDGKLSAEELRDCPALLASRQRIDTNSDGAITTDEIESRFAALDKQSDIIALDLRITSKRRPLSGATVTFTPEPFMGDGLQSYSGVTSDHGTCELIGTDVDLYGLPVGYYKVHIVHAGQSIDATHGCELADDTPTGNRVEIAL